MKKRKNMAALVQCTRKILSEFPNQSSRFLRRKGQNDYTREWIMRSCSTTAQTIPRQQEEERRGPVVPENYRHVYPEFLPDPKPEWRNSVREKLERADMLRRRAHVDLPEFYVGSVLAVTFSDPHAASGSNRFLGICIQRLGCGLRAEFTLRNVVDGQGMEMRFLLYDPRLQKVEAMRLEKRLDDELLYLRDAEPEFCTFPLDMEPEPAQDPVPINPIKVKLRPRPWYARWERKNLQGVQPLQLAEKFFKRAEELATPWEEFDLMKQYRSTIPAEEQQEVFAEVYSELHQLELTRRKMKRRRTFHKPSKTA